MSRFGFNAGEMRILKALKTPEKIQRFLDVDIAYNKEPDGDTIRSPRRVLRDRVAHCLEGALLAAAVLRVQGFPPLLLDLEAVRDDDHVLAIFKQHGHWGAIAKSNYSGLRFREPVYRNLRELAISYFEHYFNARQEKTLRNYSRPVNLSRFDRIGWMTAEEDLWIINDHLASISPAFLTCAYSGTEPGSASPGSTIACLPQGALAGQSDKPPAIYFAKKASTSVIVAVMR